ISSAGARAVPCPTISATNSLSPSAPAPARSSFSRGRSCVAGALMVPDGLYWPPMWQRCGVVIAFAVAALSCSEPPLKEFHQAEGALTAARAADAATYAPETLQAAEAALAKYDTA